VAEHTARTYEKQGLPVYRKFGTVLAKPIELDDFIKDAPSKGKMA
jgi:hypothetical protein